MVCEGRRENEEENLREVVGNVDKKMIVGCEENSGFYVNKGWKEHGSITDSSENHVDDDNVLQYQENLMNCKCNQAFSLCDNDEDKLVDVVHLSETSEHCNEYDQFHYSKEFQHYFKLLII